MSRSSLNKVRVAHITIELATPVAIGAGRSIGTEDAPIVLDAFGLPFIPGTSLAGVLRSLYAQQPIAQTVREETVFGHAAGKDGVIVSKVEVSSGILHDSQDRPCLKPPLTGDGQLQDELFHRFRMTYETAPVKRRRVRISSLGTADDKNAGLFDRTVVPSGARFTFELALWEDAFVGDMDAVWNGVLAALAGVDFRIGAQTRSGLGGTRVLAIRQWKFDCSKLPCGSEQRRFYDRVRRFEEIGGEIRRPLESQWTHRLTISPQDFWRIGNSDAGIDGQSDEAPDLAPFTEAFIDWRDGKGVWRDQALLVPGSSIKGVLRHRTAYHYQRLIGTFAPEAGELEQCRSIDDLSAIVDLFGATKKTVEIDKGEQSECAVTTLSSLGHAEELENDVGGCRGRVIIDDVLLSRDGRKLPVLMHNSIDRFTGGVRSGFLFSEQMIWGGEFEIRLNVLPTSGLVDPKIEQAFNLAIQDLSEGRLSIGAAGGRGHGRVNGVPHNG